MKLRKQGRTPVINSVAQIDQTLSNSIAQIPVVSNTWNGGSIHSYATEKEVNYYDA
jgi:hypothetical protein